MKVIDITEKEKKDFNNVVNHPLQSFEWGEFRKKTGIKVIRKGFLDNKGKLNSGFQLTIHPIPHTPWNIGYLPKGNVPGKELIEEFKKIGKREKCIFIQLEPNIEVLSKGQLASGQENLGLRPSVHPLFTKFTFMLDLTKSEEELLKNMHPKTRYNIRVAQKHQVKIAEDNSDEAFKDYLYLTHETTKRQGFYAHTEKYHRLMWETLGIQNSESRIQNLNKDKLTAHLLIAKYKPDSELSIHNSKLQAISLAAWVLFVFHDTLYYPYGASSSEHRQTMASNLMMWEVIKFGKKLGLKKFDMWGALGPNPDKSNKWFGFHRFKEGYGSKLTEFAGSYDLVINPLLYKAYDLLDKVRWSILR